MVVESEVDSTDKVDKMFGSVIKRSTELARKNTQESFVTTFGLMGAGAGGLGGAGLGLAWAGLGGVVVLGGAGFVAGAAFCAGAAALYWKYPVFSRARAASNDHEVLSLEADAAEQAARKAKGIADLTRHQLEEERLLNEIKREQLDTRRLRVEEQQLDQSEARALAMAELQLADAQLRVLTQQGAPVSELRDARLRLENAVAAARPTSQDGGTAVGDAGGADDGSNGADVGSTDQGANERQPRPPTKEPEKRL